jgi:hypothetical protein
MINGINMQNYYKVAQISRYLNSFMTQISIAKAQINNSLVSDLALTSRNGIGLKIDLYA